MNIEHGAWGFRTYQWHSVNLVPHAEIIPVYHSTTEKYGTSLCTCILGQVVILQWPSRGDFGKVLLKAMGPAWSRRRRVWYSISE